MRNLLLILTVIIVSVGATAHDRAIFSQHEEGTSVSYAPKEIDLLLLRKEIHKEVNLLRVSNGKKPLVHNHLIAKVAADHNNYLATQRKLSHEQPVEGKRTLNERFEGRTNITAGYAAAENLLRITVNNSSNGDDFYAQTAKKMVKAWNDSPSHKTNILNEKYTITGISVHFNPRNKALTVTQVFAKVGNG